MAQRNGVCVRWQTYEATGVGLNGSWGVYIPLIIGHRIYVLPSAALPVKVYELDVNRAEWRVLPLTGKVTPWVPGTAVVSWDEKLVDLTTPPGSPLFLSVVDTVLLEWQETEIHGEEISCGWNCAADFWEARRTVLFTHRGNRTEGNGVGNPTFTINVDSLRATKLKTKGLSPVPDRTHSSTFLQVPKKWIVIGGNNIELVLNRVYVLDFYSVVPTWTRIQPFVGHPGMDGFSPLLAGSRLLMFGGTSNELTNNVVGSYDLVRNIVEPAVNVDGNGPQIKKRCFQRIVMQNVNDFFFFTGMIRTGENRIVKGRINQLVN